MTDTTPSIPTYQPVPGRFNPWLVRIPILLLMAATLTLIVLATLLSAYQIAIAGRIVPGVASMGVALGGLTPEAAAERLEGAFTYDDEMVFTLRHEDRFWQVTAGELGVTFDVAATVEAALAAGTGDHPAASLVEQVRVWTTGKNIAPVVVYDEGAAHAVLRSIAAEIDQPAQNAALTIQGREVLTTPSRAGRTLDVDAALRAVTARVTALEPGGEIPLHVTESVPALLDAEAGAAYVRAALAAPLVLTTSGADGEPLGPWTISPEQIAAGLRVELVTEADGSPGYAVDVNLSALAASLEALGPGLIVPAQDGRFVYDEASGALQTLEAAVNGRRINISETIAELEAAAFRVGDRTVPIQFTYERPRYHNEITAADLGITELISSSRTFYTGSTAARRTNIEVGASYYNGVIIGPGEVFSFNQIIGDISEEQGFVEGAIIFGGRTVKGIGGGVCQVSTTAFRAAFNAGFPIVERYSHGYRVGYYELGNAGPGLDAAIFTPTADLKFANDTNAHLLIETEMLPDLNAVEFRFYGTNPGRTVEISQPVLRNVTQPPPTVYEANSNLSSGQQLQVDWSQEGGDVVITRTIRDENGDIIERRDLNTFYQPWAAVIQVAPGDSRLS